MSAGNKDKKIILLGVALGAWAAALSNGLSGLPISGQTQQFPIGAPLEDWLTRVLIGVLMGTLLGTLWLPVFYYALRRKPFGLVGIIQFGFLTLFVVAGRLLSPFGTLIWVIAFLVGPLILACLLPPVYEESGHCYYCGYNLTGNISGVCPECGRQFCASTGTSTFEAK